MVDVNQNPNLQTFVVPIEKIIDDGRLVTLEDLDSPETQQQVTG